MIRLEFISDLRHRKKAHPGCEQPEGHCICDLLEASGQLRLVRQSLQFASDIGESRVCGATNGSDCGQADDHDQSQHNGVLNSCWAVF